MAITLSPKSEIVLNKLTINYPMLHRVICSVFMTYLAKNGLKINYERDNFYAVLPRRRINLNWYGTMGGGAILANVELAGGAYLFMLTEGKYRMICKHQDYNILLPSSGAVMFKASLDEAELESKIAAGKKFLINVKVKTYRANGKNQAGRRTGSGNVTFYVWPVGE